MKDEVADNSRCPFESLCERACSGDYELCYEETSRTGINHYGKVIKHPHVVVMYEGKRAGGQIFVVSLVLSKTWRKPTRFASFNSLKCGQPL
jgi:hypothetical protein